MKPMPRVPESTKTSLRQRLNNHARDRWVDLDRIDIRWRANFAYIDAHLTTGDIVPLCRLRHHLGLRPLPSQPRRLPRQLPPQRRHRWQPARRPRLRRQPLPHPNHDELTSGSTSGRLAAFHDLAVHLHPEGI